MDDSRFDRLARSLTESRSRRGLAPFLGALTLGGSPLLLDLATTHAKKKHKKRKKKRKKAAPTVPPAVPPAPPPLALAYTCPGPRENVVGTTGPARQAQSFTAERGGTLRQITFAITKSGDPGDYSVQLIRAGSATPSFSPLDVLAVAIIPDATVPAGDTTLVGNFISPELVAGAQYAAVVSRLGTTAGLTVHTRQGDGSACPGQFFSAIGAGAFMDVPAIDLIVTVLVE